MSNERFKKLEEAIKAVENGMSVYKASREYGIPKTTLLRRRKNNIPIEKKSGPPCVLNTDQEKHLADWIFHLSSVGFSVTRTMLLDSDSGWMTGETFFEYVTTIFYPWLIEHNIEFPVALFVDGHTSHLTLHLSKFCSEKKITLIALPPNATHILQPLDVAVFRSLKEAWRSSVTDWRMQNCGQRILRENFATILETALEKGEMSKNVISGFRTTGLYPFDPNALNYNKLFSTNLNLTTSTPVEKPKINSKLTENLKFLEEEIGEQKISLFQHRLEGVADDVPIEDKSLFDLWKNIKLRTKNPEKISQFENEAENNECLNLGDSTLTNNLDDTNFVLSNALNELLEDSDSGEVINQNNLEQPTDEKNPEKKDQKSCHPQTPSPFNDRSRQLSDQVNIPTPFKKNLFWPEPKFEAEGAGPRRRREKLPAVASSDQWIDYYNNKKMKIEKKLKKGVAKRKLKEQSKKIKIRKTNDTNNNNNDEKKSKFKELKPGQYIVVNYEEELFPGIILEKNDNEAKVKVMTMCGVNWKWPEKEDTLWYNSEQVVCAIQEPKLLNARGIYMVEEIKNIKNNLNG